MSMETARLPHDGQKAGQPQPGPSASLQQAPQNRTVPAQRVRVRQQRSRPAGTPLRQPATDQRAKVVASHATDTLTSKGTTMAQGTVKWFNLQKGYGFIEQEDGKDVFAHVAELAPGVTTLSEGQRVEFDLQEGQKGPQAVNTKPV